MSKGTAEWKKKFDCWVFRASALTDYLTDYLPANNSICNTTTLIWNSVDKVVVILLRAISQSSIHVIGHSFKQAEAGGPSRHTQIQDF